MNNSNNSANSRITMAHGSGGLDSAELMRDVFAKYFNNEILARLEDSAIVDLSSPCISPRIAVSTDSFVVTPLVFPGGDIGKLAVCGTVNDVLMSGATPLYLTCGFIIETGLSISLLDSICASLATEAARAGVTIIAGDTKVIEGRGEDSGLIINTTGLGTLGENVAPTPSGIRPGDAILVSGNLGDHHAAILSARLGIENAIQSDCALLTPITDALREADIQIHAMRDVTRGGLATVLNELAVASGVSIALEEDSIPVSPPVKAFCGLLGLDPLYMGNEGKLTLSVTQQDAERALYVIRKTEIGKNASIIGSVLSKPNKEQTSKSHLPPVSMSTHIGGSIRIDVLYGEGLPRIC